MQVCNALFLSSFLAFLLRHDLGHGLSELEKPCVIMQLVKRSNTTKENTHINVVVVARERESACKSEIE